jgi:hypothetical protein
VISVDRAATCLSPYQNGFISKLSGEYANRAAFDLGCSNALLSVLIVVKAARDDHCAAACGFHLGLMRVGPCWCPVAFAGRNFGETNNPRLVDIRKETSPGIRCSSTRIAIFSSGSTALKSRSMLSTLMVYARKAART